MSGAQTLLSSYTVIRQYYPLSAGHTPGVKSSNSPWRDTMRTVHLVSSLMGLSVLTCDTREGFFTMRAVPELHGTTS